MKVNFAPEYKKYSGFENMDIDLSMLDYAIKNQDDNLSVRFYGWRPRCVSLGRNQKEFQTEVQIDIVRRPTGGRALLHDNEITYCVIGKIPKNQSVIETYREISNALIAGFERMNIKLEYAQDKGGDKKYCMNINSGADVCYKGKKLIGSAQFRKEGYFLQHGSILKDVDFDLLEKIFMEPVNKEKIATLKSINPDFVDQEVIENIKKGFVSYFCD